jgi:hypothetical protein
VWGRYDSTLVVAAVLVLNVADAAFTIVWTSAGLAVEANPFLVGALAASPVLFMAAKIALVSSSMLLLLRLRRCRLALACLYGCGWLYIGIVAYHVTKIPTLVASLN